VGTELVNESSIFTGYGIEDFPPAFEAELQKLYQAWGGKGKITRFAWNWSTQSLKAVEIWKTRNRACAFWQPPRKPPTRTCAVPPSLGAKSLIHHEQPGLPLLVDLRANAKMDHIDTHAYWDLLWRVDANGGQPTMAPFDNTSQLPKPVQGFTRLWQSLPKRSWTRPQSSPNGTICAPNEYRLEGPGPDGLLRLAPGLGAACFIRSSPLTCPDR